MTNLMRPKVPVIYGSCSDYWQKGPVAFIAHAVYNDGNVVCLGAEYKSAGGSPTPPNHPDQKYWDKVVNIDAAKLVRVEVDCTLMPCCANDQGCLFKVPQLIKERVGSNTTIRFFSHRNEGMGVNAMESKRSFDCTTSMNTEALNAAYAANRYWKWAAPTSKQFAGREYYEI